MARAKITAPLDPAVARRAEAEELRAKAGRRTAAETARYIALLEREVDSFDRASGRGDTR